MGFSRQEDLNGSPFPSPGDHPDPGNKPRSPVLQVDSLPSESLGKPFFYKGLINTLGSVRLSLCHNY